MGLVIMLTYLLVAQSYYYYLAFFKPLGFATFSCSLTVRDHVFYCAITVEVEVVLGCRGGCRQMQIQMQSLSVFSLRLRY